MPAFFRPNPNLANELEAEPQYRSGLAKATQPAVAAAKNFAPVRTGAYRDSIRVVEDGRKVYLSAFDFKAWWIEVGSANNTPSAPLRRGARAAGLKLKESDR